jgi:hypothetical protein
MKITNYLKTKLGKSLHILSGLSASMILLSTVNVSAQSTSEMIKSDSHIGGYNIKCNGQSTGVLEAIPEFGTAPYTFLWNTGETSAIITDKPAGIYFVTAIDVNNNMQTDTFELKQPSEFTFESRMSDYNGYQVSTNGNNNGKVEILANGGTPPYQYLWSNGDNTNYRSGLSAGSYDFVVSDANQCSVNGTVILTEPSPLQVSFTNVQGTSCFGGSDGKASLNINGGLGDFSVMWENGSFSLSPDDLSSGYNAVRIFEQGKAVMDTSILIPEPNVMESEFVLSEYNGFNVSCADCFNGSINANVTGGTAPYSFQWNDINNSTTQILTNLNGGDYVLLVTDANGCTSKNVARLTMPSPKDWSRLGNSNVDAAEFIGTTDNSSIAFKTNNEVRMKMTGDIIQIDAHLKMSNVETDTTVSDSTQILAVDADGNIKSILIRDVVAEIDNNDLSTLGCINCGCSPVLGWGHSADLINGVAVPLLNNDIVKCPVDGNVGIGTTAPEANSKLDLQGEIAISGERLSVLYNGKVGVGTATPSEKFEVYNGNFKVTCPWDEPNPVLFASFSNKNVGIGTSAPRGKFEIKMDASDHISFGRMRTEMSGWATSYIGLNAYREDGGIWKTTGDINNSGAAVLFANSFGDLMFTTINGANAPYEVLTADAGIKSGTKMTLTNTGVLGIGINPHNHADLLTYKLVVDGNIKCKKLRVDLQNWADYVFDPSYDLMDLNSIEQYIAENKHLPGMPSANQIEKEGADLGEIVKMQQVKIEELTLLMIQMQKQIDTPTHRN